MNAHTRSLFTAAAFLLALPACGQEQSTERRIERTVERIVESATRVAERVGDERWCTRADSRSNSAGASTAARVVRCCCQPSFYVTCFACDN